MIVPQHLKPDRPSSSPNTQSPIPKINQRSPITNNKTRSPIPSTSKQRSPLSPPTKPDRLFLHQTAIAPSTPTKPDRLFPQIKQRSPLITQHSIAYFPHQTAIASQHHKPDRLNSTSNNDRPSNSKPDRLFPQIKQRSPHTTHKTDRLSPKIKQRSPLTTHKTRSPISPHQTAIAPHHPQNLIAYSLNTKQRSPSPTTKPNRLFPLNQTAIAPSTPTNLIAYQSIKITRLSVVNFDYWQ
ncbi:hypothetical protein [Pseudanabaena sp. UWO310]|uniref:hypothetical protein n=1 Tax=Pseudanabaena sp. UWO310 TaxID=2480795 RepID=UPI00115B60C6|nr:hypothetical protein [Pseudanabaena sp. UWO310]TYQ29773.1 hypothetical protein PseudUWO310_12215 [Pseudanabaena sp. UWO310]